MSSFAAVTKGLAAAAVMLVGGAVARETLVAPPARFAPPILSISTLTNRGTPPSVTVLARWVRRCLGAVCPTTYQTTVTLRSAGMGRLVHARTTAAFRDTAIITRSVCPLVGPPPLDTIVYTVGALLAGAVEQSPLATMRIPLRCRAITAEELAEGRALEDSFPKGPDRGIAMGDWHYKLPASERRQMEIAQLRQARMAADSLAVQQSYARITAGPDSIRTTTSGDTLIALKGYKTAMCWLGRNRYTGQVQILDGDPVLCEPPRARRQSQRSG